MEDAAWFMDEMFGEAVSSDNQIAIWTLKDKRTKFFSTTADATVYALGQSDDVYFGLGLYDRGITHGRGTANDVTYITCLWADIDFGDHKKDKIPKTEEEAMTILDRIGLRSSILVHSGGGLHPYWLFNEPMPVTAETKTLLARWAATVKACSSALGFAVDSVWDLARVLRVPETRNCKNPDKIMPVKIISSRTSAVRYDKLDIEEWCVDVESFKDTSAIKIDTVAISLEARPPSQQLEAALANNAKFKRTWEYDRRDMPDTSPSAYDLSLATQAASFNWSDQEITDLLIWFRTKHNLEPNKIQRRSYIEATLRAARASTEPQKAIGVLVNTPVQPVDNGQKAKEHHANIVREYVGKALTVPIDKFIQHGREAADFNLILKDGTDINIGTALEVLSQPNWRAKIMEAKNNVFDPIKPENWIKIIKQLMTIVTFVDNPLSGRTNRLHTWMANYLLKRAPYSEDQRDTAIIDGLPVIIGGELYVPYKGFCDHALVHEHAGKESYIWKALRVAGWEHTHLWAQRRVKKTYYKCPIDTQGVAESLGWQLEELQPQ